VAQLSLRAARAVPRLAKLTALPYSSLPASFGRGAYFGEALRFPDTPFRLAARIANPRSDKRCAQREIRAGHPGNEGLISGDLADFPPVNPWRCDYFAMGASEAAQAMQLVRALRDQLAELTAQLAEVERKDVTLMKKGRASAVRLHAAALRRDIKEAQSFIEELQRRYLTNDERVAPATRART
jgi:hypothetical protein